MNILDDVKRFHAAANIPIQDRPLLSDDMEVRKLRANLLVEEILEYLEAEKTHNLVEIADGLIDIVYIAVGTCIVYGIPFDMIWDEVQRSNMDKFKDGPQIRYDGKVLKPEGWRPPRIKEILKSACGPHHFSNQE